MDEHDEVKLKIATAIEDFLNLRHEMYGMRMPHDDCWEECFEALSEHVYSEIWEYIKDYD